VDRGVPPLGAVAGPSTNNLIRVSLFDEE